MRTESLSLCVSVDPEKLDPDGFIKLWDLAARDGDGALATQCAHEFVVIVRGAREQESAVAACGPCGHTHGVDADHRRRAERQRFGDAGESGTAESDDADLRLRITGEGGARLSSFDKAARTNVTSEHLEMDFDVASGESQLHRAVATGKAAVESKPLATAGVLQRETRLLRSEGIEAIDVTADRPALDARIDLHMPNSNVRTLRSGADANQRSADATGRIPSIIAIVTSTAWGRRSRAA